jgi:hypothetical protein
MSMTIFVVQKHSFNRDSDYPYQEEGSFPREAYRSGEQARQKCDELNDDKYITENPFDWNEDPLYGADLGRLSEIEGLTDIADKDDVNDRWGDLSDNSRISVWRDHISDNYFFTVREIQLVDCEVREPAETA